MRKQTGSQVSLYRDVAVTVVNGMVEQSGWFLSRSFRKLQFIGCLLAVGVGERQGVRTLGVLF